MIKRRKSRKIGDIGEDLVNVMFQRFEWNVWATNNRDKGTDLIVLGSGADRPVAFGVQVKTGPNYFKRRERDDNGNVIGWWHSKSPRRHYNYWTKHTLPHILVLYNDEEGVAYWAHITADKVKATGLGRKMFVPANQKIEESQRGDLLAVAFGREHPPILEGTAFWASAENIELSHQLRYALIAPRLVAPHPNTGYQNPINAVEAVALLALCRFQDLRGYAEQHPEVPNLQEELPEDCEWAWSFAVGIWEWMTGDIIDTLSAAYDSAPGGSEKAASGVLLVCALMRMHRHGRDTDLHEGYGEALAVLDELLNRDDLVSADLGWALVQRSRLNTSVGREDDAEGDARTALENFVDGRDVTVTALAASAAAAVWSIVFARDSEEADLGGLITASDNAVAWWRSQMISGALSASVRTQFDVWAGKQFLLPSTPNTGAASLFAAELSADILGDHGTWRHLSSLRARQRLVSAKTTGDELGELVEGIDALRVCGDSSSLESAIVSLMQVGPIEAVAESVNRIPTTGWTTTAAAANFCAIRVAGELIAQETATELLLWIARIGRGDTTATDEQILRSVLLEQTAIWAASGLMRSAANHAHQAVAEMIVALPRPHLDHPANRVRHIIPQLDFDQVAMPERQALSDLGQEDQSYSGTAALGWLAANDATEALSVLKHRATSGNLLALLEIPLRALESTDAALIIERLAEKVRETISSAQNGSFNIVGFNTSGPLTTLNLWFPNEARWDPIVELLSEPRVYERDKHACCSVIIQSSKRLPDEVGERLAEIIDDIASAAFATGPASDSSIATVTAIAIGRTRDNDADTAIAKLASGSSQERQNVSLLLGTGRMPHMQPVLASLTRDASFDVRRATAEAVGALAAANPSPLIEELARSLATDSGTELPMVLLGGLSQQEDHMSEVGMEIAQQLLQNPSARLRFSARRLLDRCHA